VDKKEQEGEGGEEAPAAPAAAPAAAEGSPFQPEELPSGAAKGPEEGGGES
jgi:hypothetical protein